MINVFVLQNGRLNQVPIDSREDLEQVAPVWVDLTGPNDDERAWVKTIYGVLLPGEDEVKDIEASARYYEAENGDLHLRTDLLLEEVSGRVLQKEFTDQDAAAALNAIAREEDLNGRIRRNMMDTRRAVSFLMRGRLLNSEQFDEARQILRDIESLDGHTSFLFDKINFLMDATVGFININQNKIIKIFSVASVAFLPPTLIASVYGMNFEFLPELHWKFGYGWSLALMVISAI